MSDDRGFRRRNLEPPETYSEPHLAVARAQKYARLAGTTYDEIGYRAMVATPTKGDHFPLTATEARHLARRLAGPVLPPEVAALLAQAPKLRHRPIAMPDGPFHHVVEDDLINLTRATESDGVLWSFPPGAPPSAFLEDAADRDGWKLLPQPSGLPWMRWLPLLTLIRNGRFERMQDCRADLVSEPAPGQFQCFVSHRWLTRTAPDPDNRQAALIAWQLVSAMCDAVYVAHDRGLHVPRKRSSLLAQFVGRSGSELAESLIVNVLRLTLNSTNHAAVHAEILGLEQITADGGVRAGREDLGLGRLRELVATHPLLRDLLARVRLWYDYSCLPQEPRTAAEQAEFEQGRDRIDGFQLFSRTAILLDDVDDYFSRAWCMLEALNTNLTPSVVLLVGAERPAGVAKAIEYHVEALLLNQPHFVWRALLDTEVFGVQTPAACLSRLGLAASRDEDLPAIYAGLRRLRAPADIPIDGGDVVTGTFPLPVVSRVVFLPITGRWPVERPGDVATLNWFAALSLPPAKCTMTASLLNTGRSGTPTCHVVVVGSCEGESVLLSNWVLARAAELEQFVGGTLASLSWLAADAAPVGHFTEAGLRTCTIRADQWVVVSRCARFGHCSVVNSVLSVLLATRAQVFTLFVDSTRDNLTRLQSTDPRDTVVSVDATLAHRAEWRGGLFRDHLLGELRAAVRGGDW